MTLLVVHDDRRIAMPPGWLPLAGDRADDGWTWRAYDNAGRYTGPLEGVESGSLDMNVHDEVRGGGSLSWSGAPEAMPEWRHTRVRPVYWARLMDGTQLEWEMGEYLCSSPSTSHVTGFASAQVTLSDRTTLLLRPKLVKMLALPAGTDVVAAVRAQLDANGIKRHAIADSTKTLRTPLAWDVGTTVLRVVNDLLAAAGYFGVWADAQGVLRSSPYVDPAARPLEWTFEDRQGASAHEEEITHDADDTEVPNRVTVASRGDGYSFELVATRTLDQISPGHKYSFEKTGGWIDRHEDGVDITDNAALISYTERLLREGIQITSKLTVDHAPLPLELHDRVAVASSGVLAPSATIQTMSISCETGANWTSTLREVA